MENGKVNNFYQYVKNNDINVFKQWHHGWIAAVVDPFIEWPEAEHLVTINHPNDAFKQEYTFLFTPFYKNENKIFLPLIVTKNRNDPRHGKQKLLDFISSLSYFHDEAILISQFNILNRFQSIKSNVPINYYSQISRQNNFYAKSYFILNNEKLKLAIALFRDGLNLSKINSIYAALSFYKIFEALNSICCERTGYIHELKGCSWQEAIKEEKEIYKTFRCAIAHADLMKGKVKNPDKITDIELVSKKLPLIKEIVKMLINRKCNDQGLGDDVLPRVNKELS